MHPRLYRLLEKHQRIDEQLRLEQHRAGPNWAAVLRLKRLKLRIKDMIHRLTRKTARI
jgi:hypothetical protein